MNVYLNFHRPCGFATIITDRKGKEKKKYETYLTPFEKLRSIEDWEHSLKPGETKQNLEALERAQSDNDNAAALQKAKSELFTTISNESRKS
jgi:hypothetical protein